MPTWEFLLQKKGDKSWLPLESPTLEILEGEYRLAGRCGIFNTSIDIQIDYISNDQETTGQPLHRRFTRYVNSQGLLLITPFHNFSSGTWQFKCIHNSGIKSLNIEVLAAIASDWDFFDQISEQETNQLSSTSQPASLSLLAKLDKLPTLEPLLAIELAELDLITVLNQKYPPKTTVLPTELITLHQAKFAIKGKTSFEITGEAYLSGEIDIILKDAHTKIIHSQYTHNITDSDFFSYSITIPDQLETQILSGEVRIRPHQHIEQNRHIICQSISIHYQAIVDPFRKFPILPFENLPTHVPVPRNIKFPELPEFLTGRKLKSKAVLATPKTPIPNWNIANAFQVPSYQDKGDLRFEFE